MCRRSVANRNQVHTCAVLRSIDTHFADKPVAVRALFEAFVAAVHALGPVEILPEKTRIAFHVRMSFAQITPRKHSLDGHLVLAQRHEAPCFCRVQTFSARNHLHCFRLRAQEDLSTALFVYLAQAYDVGCQNHLRQRP